MTTARQDLEHVHAWLHERGFDRLADRIARVDGEMARVELRCDELLGRLASVEKERDEAFRNVWEHTPGWVGEQLPDLAAFLDKIARERDELRDIVNNLTAKLERSGAHVERIANAAGYLTPPVQNPLPPLEEFVAGVARERDEARAEVERLRGELADAKTDRNTLTRDLSRLTSALRSIAEYDRIEIVKDEFAYDRMQEAYREVARRALEGK